MIFLTSPDLGEPVEVWETWISELLKMPQRDPSVIFALQRARRVVALTTALSATHQPVASEPHEPAASAEAAP